MSKKAQIAFIGGLTMIAVLGGVLAVSLPRVTDPVPRPAAPVAPNGYRPVGPGSYTFIPEATPVAQVPRPAAPVAPSGHKPVAPGSYTSIPDPTPAGGAPVAPDGYRPVAPGSYTTIPDGD